MANEWIITDGQACYNSDAPGFTLVQSGAMEIGKLYSAIITVDMSQGKLSIPSLDGNTTIIASGTYQFVLKALYTDLIILPESYGAGVFDGCIEIVELLYIPYYNIVDCDDNAVFGLLDDTGVTAAQSFIQYQVDWTEIAEGSYFIKFEDSTLEYASPCLNLKLLHPCTKQITWNCDENAWGFNYSDLSFTQSLRITADLQNPRYKALSKDVYEFSNGDLKITYVSKAKEFLLKTEFLPEYIHDALQLALDSDNFFIDGIKYVFQDDEYSPSWEKRSKLSSIDIILRQAQDLKNTNCG